MAFNKTDRPEGAKMRRPGGMRRRKKVCVFCGDKNGVIDYKDTNKLKRYVSERGKNPSSSYHWQLRKASESFNCSYQARSPHRTHAICMRIIFD
jgi:S18: ribosomal protein S18